MGFTLEKKMAFGMSNSSFFSFAGFNGIHNCFHPKKMFFEKSCFQKSRPSCYFVCRTFFLLKPPFPYFFSILSLKRETTMSLACKMQGALGALGMSLHLFWKKFCIFSAFVMWETPCPQMEFLLIF